MASLSHAWLAACAASPGTFTPITNESPRSPPAGISRDPRVSKSLIGTKITVPGAAPTIAAAVDPACPAAWLRSVRTRCSYAPA